MAADRSQINGNASQTKSASFEWSVGHLNGHKDEVTYLCQHPQHPHIILSASVDGTVRYWDIEARKTIKVLVWRKASHGDIPPEEGDTSISCILVVPNGASNDTETVVLCRGNEIGVFEKVQVELELGGDSSMIYRAPSSILHIPDAEELNALSYVSSSEGVIRIMAADDSGAVFPVEIKDEESSGYYTPTYAIHSNVCTYCAAVQSQKYVSDDHNARCVISSGMDCRVIQSRHFFDVRQGTAGPSVLFDTTIGSQEQSLVAIGARGSSAISPSSTGSQALNPPFVHSIAIDRTHTWIACSVGDGSCAILDMEEGTEQMRLFGEHANSVVCVAWFDVHGLAECDTTDAVAPENCVVTAGTDGRIVVWRVDHALQQSDRQRIVRRLKLSQKMASKKGARKGAAKPQDLVPPEVAYRILHRKSAETAARSGTSINWIVASPACGDSILVCDTSDQITYYTELSDAITRKLHS
eukprot:gb/GECG01011676.1/.p1 GENE.gb/GECG01011676.1/~~gb/GECG01011676.1/.p1  ORF type:complete len:470 (+),score=48.95 gb/GECG01011676.1/:1-1410(+)